MTCTNILITRTGIIVLSAITGIDILGATTIIYGYRYLIEIRQGRFYLRYFLNYLYQLFFFLDVITSRNFVTINYKLSKIP